MIITADLHLHPHPSWSRVLENGMNSRLEVGKRALFHLTELAARDVLVISGDLLHDRESIPVEVLDVLGEWQQLVRQHQVTVWLLSGNHDQYLRSGDCHSIKCLRGNPDIHVITEPTRLKLDAEYHFIPYYADPEQTEAALAKLPGSCTVFMHCDIKGAYANGGHKCEHGVQLGDQERLIIAGHYHRPQQVARNVHYVGSPYQTVSSEAGEGKRYFRLVNGNKLTSHDLTFPEFRSITFREWEDKRDLLQDGNYYTITCNSLPEYERVKRHGVFEWKASWVPPKVTFEQDNQGGEAVTSTGAVNAWLNAKGLEHLRDKALARIA